ncbi:unnamed protein product [Amoebophrya sp. A25]|nr:unnamed protein product [Amoebophrya sp. A25]|eukprot:GSA25T00025746001.1
MPQSPPRCRLPEDIFRQEVSNKGINEVQLEQEQEGAVVKGDRHHGGSSSFTVEQEEKQVSFLNEGFVLDDSGSFVVEDASEEDMKNTSTTSVEELEIQHQGVVPTPSQASEVPGVEAVQDDIRGQEDDEEEEIRSKSNKNAHLPSSSSTSSDEYASPQQCLEDGLEELDALEASSPPNTQPDDDPDGDVDDEDDLDHLEDKPPSGGDSGGLAVNVDQILEEIGSWRQREPLTPETEDMEEELQQEEGPKCTAQMTRALQLHMQDIFEFETSNDVALNKQDAEDKTTDGSNNRLRPGARIVRPSLAEIERKFNPPSAEEGGRKLDAVEEDDMSSRIAISGNSNLPPRVDHSWRTTSGSHSSTRGPGPRIPAPTDYGVFTRGRQLNPTSVTSSSGAPTPSFNKTSSSTAGSTAAHSTTPGASFLSSHGASNLTLRGMNGGVSSRFGDKRTSCFVKGTIVDEEDVEVVSRGDGHVGRGEEEAEIMRRLHNIKQMEVSEADIIRRLQEQKNGGASSSSTYQNGRGSKNHAGQQQHHLNSTRDHEQGDEEDDEEDGDDPLPPMVIYEDTDLLEQMTRLEREADGGEDRDSGEDALTAAHRLRLATDRERARQILELEQRKIAERRRMEAEAIREEETRQARQMEELERLASTERHKRIEAERLKTVGESSEFYDRGKFYYFFWRKVLEQMSNPPKPDEGQQGLPFHLQTSAWLGNSNGSGDAEQRARVEKHRLYAAAQTAIRQLGQVDHHQHGLLYLARHITSCGGDSLEYPDRTYFEKDEEQRINIKVLDDEVDKDIKHDLSDEKMTSQPQPTAPGASSSSTQHEDKAGGGSEDSREPPGTTSNVTRTCASKKFSVYGYDFEDIYDTEVVTRAQLASQELMNNLQRERVELPDLAAHFMFALYSGRMASTAHVTGVLSHLVTHHIHESRDWFLANDCLYLQWLGVLLPEIGTIDLLLMLFLGPNSNYQPGPVKQVIADLNCQWAREACHGWLSPLLRKYIDGLEAAIRHRDQQNIMQLLESTDSLQRSVVPSPTSVESTIEEQDDVCSRVVSSIVAGACTDMSSKKTNHVVLSNSDEETTAPSSSSSSSSSAEEQEHDAATPGISSDEHDLKNKKNERGQHDGTVVEQEASTSSTTTSASTTASTADLPDLDVLPSLICFFLRLLEHMEKIPKPLKERETLLFLHTMVDESPFLEFLAACANQNNEEYCWDAIRCIEVVLSVAPSLAYRFKKPLLRDWIHKRPDREYKSYNAYYPASPVEAILAGNIASGAANPIFSLHLGGGTYSLLSALGNEPGAGGVVGGAETAAANPTTTNSSSGYEQQQDSSCNPFAGAAVGEMHLAPFTAASTSASSDSAIGSSASASSDRKNSSEENWAQLVQGIHASSSTSCFPDRQGVVKLISDARADQSSNASTRSSSTLRLGSYVTCMLRLVSTTLKSISENGCGPSANGRDYLPAASSYYYHNPVPSPGGVAATEGGMAVTEILYEIPLDTWQRWTHWYQQTTKRNQTAHLYLTQLFKLLITFGQQPSSSIEDEQMNKMSQQAGSCGNVLFLRGSASDEGAPSASDEQEQSCDSGGEGGINTFKSPEDHWATTSNVAPASSSSCSQNDAGGVEMNQEGGSSTSSSTGMPGAGEEEAASADVSPSSGRSAAKEKAGSNVSTSTSGVPARSGRRFDFDLQKAVLPLILKQALSEYVRFNDEKYSHRRRDEALRALYSHYSATYGEGALGEFLENLNLDNRAGSSGAPNEEDQQDSTTSPPNLQGTTSNKRRLNHDGDDDAAKNGEGDAPENDDASDRDMSKDEETTEAGTPDADGDDDIAKYDDEDEDETNSAGLCHKNSEKNDSTDSGDQAEDDEHPSSEDTASDGAQKPSSSRFSRTGFLQSIAGKAGSLAGSLVDRVRRKVTDVDEDESGDQDDDDIYENCAEEEEDDKTEAVVSPTSSGGSSASPEKSATTSVFSSTRRDVGCKAGELAKSFSLEDADAASSGVPFIIGGDSDNTDEGPAQVEGKLNESDDSMSNATSSFYRNLALDALSDDLINAELHDAISCSAANIVGSDGDRDRTTTSTDIKHGTDEVVLEDIEDTPVVPRPAGSSTTGDQDLFGEVVGESDELSEQSPSFEEDGLLAGQEGVMTKKKQPSPGDLAEIATPEDEFEDHSCGSSSEEEENLLDFVQKTRPDVMSSGADELLEDNDQEQEDQHLFDGEGDEDITGDQDSTTSSQESGDLFNGTMDFSSTTMALGSTGFFGEKNSSSTTQLKLAMNNLRIDHDLLGEQDEDGEEREDEHGEAPEVNGDDEDEVRTDPGDFFEDRGRDGLGDHVEDDEEDRGDGDPLKSSAFTGGEEQVEVGRAQQDAVDGDTNPPVEVEEAFFQHATMDFSVDAAVARARSPAGAVSPSGSPLVDVAAIPDSEEEKLPSPPPGMRRSKVPTAKWAMAEGTAGYSDLLDHLLASQNAQLVRKLFSNDDLSDDELIASGVSSGHERSQEEEDEDVSSRDHEAATTNKNTTRTLSCSNDNIAPTTVQAQSNASSSGSTLEVLDDIVNACATSLFATEAVGSSDVSSGQEQHPSTSSSSSSLFSEEKEQASTMNAPLDADVKDIRLDDCTLSEEEISAMTRRLKQGQLKNGGSATSSMPSTSTSASSALSGSGTFSTTRRKGQTTATASTRPRENFYCLFNGEQDRDYDSRGNFSSGGASSSSSRTEDPFSSKDLDDDDEIDDDEIDSEEYHGTSVVGGSASSNTNKNSSSSSSSSQLLKKSLSTPANNDGEPGGHHRVDKATRPKRKLVRGSTVHGGCSEKRPHLSQDDYARLQDLMNRRDLIKEWWGWDGRRKKNQQTHRSIAPRDMLPKLIEYAEKENRKQFGGGGGGSPINPF